MERNKIITQRNNTYQYDEINQQLVYLSPIINELTDIEKQGVDLTLDAGRYVKQLAEKYEIPEDQAWLQYKKYLFFREHRVFSPDTDME